MPRQIFQPSLLRPTLPKVITIKKEDVTDDNVTGLLIMGQVATHFKGLKYSAYVPSTKKDKFYGEITETDVDAGFKAAYRVIELGNLLEHFLNCPELGPNTTDHHAEVKRVFGPLIPELIAVTKKGKIKESNMTSLYKSVNITNVSGLDRDLMRTMLWNAPDVLTPDSVVSKWGSYHLKVNSTPTLIKRFLDEVGEIAVPLLKITNGEKALISASDDEIIDHKIPERIIGAAMTYYEAGGVNIGTWYQGIKARDMIPAAKLARLRDVFKRYIELSAGTGDLRGVTRTSMLIGLATGEVTLEEIAEHDRLKADANSAKQALRDAIIKQGVEHLKPEDIQAQMSNIMRGAA